MKHTSRPYHDMLLYGSALLLLRGASLITLPVMTYFLSIEQIGQLELISVTQIFFSLLIALAMHENLYRFIATTQDANEQKAMTSQLYTTSLLLSCGLIIMVSGLFWTMNLLSNGAVKLQNFSDSQLVLMASAIAIQGSLEISLAWLRLQNKALTFFKISLICTCLQVGLILAVVSIIPSVTAVLAVGVFCAFVQMGLLHFYNRFSWQTLSLEQLKHYLRYCLPIMLSALVAFGLNGGERWLLAQSADLALLAQYAIAIKFALAVGILLQPFHMWWMPKRFEYWQNQGETTTSNISQYGIVYACVLALLVTWLGKLFILLFLPSQYQLASDILALAVVAMLCKELAEILNIGILKTQKTSQLFSINLVTTTIAIGCVWLVVLQFPNLALWTVCSGVALAQLTRCLVILTFSQKSCPLPYQLGKLTCYLLLTFTLIASSWMSDTIVTSILIAIMETILLVAAAHHLGLLKLPYQNLRRAIVRLSL